MRTKMFFLAVFLLVVSMFFSCKEQEKITVEKQFTVSNFSTTCNIYPNYSHKYLEDSSINLAEFAEERGIYLEHDLASVKQSYSKEDDGQNIHLLNFWDPVSIDQVLTQMKDFGYKPATLKEVITLDLRLLDIYEIVALGTSLPSGEYPVFCGVLEEIGIYSGSRDGIICTHNDLRRFAAVKIKNK